MFEYWKFLEILEEHPDHVVKGLEYHPHISFTTFGSGGKLLSQNTS